MSNFIRNSIGGRALNVSFNSDCKYFSVATEDGFQIRNAASCDTRMSLGSSTAVAHRDSHQISGFISSLILTLDLPWRVSSAAMLDSSQIIGLTKTPAKKNELCLMDSISRKSVGNITVDEPIVRALLTSHYIVVASNNHVHVYTHSTVNIKHLATYDTTDNPQGICALGRRFCVFPARSPGQIQIIQLSNDDEAAAGPAISHRIMPAHSSQLKALCLTADEEIICSASANGTLIRLHSTKSGAKLGELRRGVGSATIYSLAASPSGGQLAVTSDTNTLHVFNLPTSHLQRGANANAVVSIETAHDAEWQTVDRSPSPVSSTPEPSGSYLNWQKWGSLAKLPFAPRVLSDVYSFVHVAFDPGNDDEDVSSSPTRGSGRTSVDLSRSNEASQGQRRVKGLVGWVDDETIVVLSAGRDARYERFKLDLDQQGPATLRRVGWSRYMRPN